MAELAVIRVLNVVNAWEKTDEYRGVKRTEHWVTFAVEGGFLHLTHDPSLDVPLNWSGRAVVSCEIRSFNYVDKDNKERTKFYLSPKEIKSFEKGYHHPALDDIIPKVK